MCVTPLPLIVLSNPSSSFLTSASTWPGDQHRLVVLFRFEGSVQPSSMTNASLWTDDVEGTYRELKAKGVVLTVEPTKQPWGTFAIFKDVDGNTFVLGTK